MQNTYSTCVHKHGTVVTASYRSLTIYNLFKKEMYLGLRLRLADGVY